MTRLGPFEGARRALPEQPLLPDELWHKDLRLIYDDRHCKSHYIDASDPAVANYLVFLRGAALSEQTDHLQNLHMYQWRGQVYFLTYEDIPAGQELIAW